ncbi:MAG: alpha/beta hydrolase family protein [Lachnospiraceae bacterium]
MNDYLKTKNNFFHLDQNAPGSLHVPPAMMHEPADSSSKRDVGIVLVHHSADYLTFTPAEELAKRGYCVLCANTVGQTLDSKILDVKLAVDYLKNCPGIKKVILLGHSGGSTLMGAYQAIAENGVGIFQDAGKIYRFPEIETLTAADGIMMLDANFGNSIMTLFSLDPAITDETNGKQLEPSLDLFKPENGYHPEASAYSEEFIRRYQKAQGERMNRLVELAHQRLDKIEHRQGNYDDDEPFIIPGATLIAPNNKLLPQNIRLLSRTRNPHLLLHPDGSATTQIVPCVRQQVNPVPMTHLFGSAAANTTVRTFLGSYAVGVSGDFSCDEENIYGIDWNSCFNSAISSIRHVSVPLLAMGMTGGYEYLAAEFIYDNAKSKDKTIAFVEGASHDFKPARNCEEYEGQFGDTVKTLFDCVDQWLKDPDRFL